MVRKMMSATDFVDNYVPSGEIVVHGASAQEFVKPLTSYTEQEFCADISKVLVSEKVAMSTGGAD